MKIKVGTKDIVETLKVTISNVNVTLELDDASSVTFTVTSAYELTNTAFNSNVKTTLKLGETITVELGYGSDLAQVFQGLSRT
jgi:phage protein D